MSVMLVACIVEQSVHLNIENQLSTDITLNFYTSQQNGQLSVPRHLGVILTGQTGKTTGTIILGGIGAEPKVIIQAEDSSGRVIWQKTWTGEEFVKLKDTGWKIVVSSDTSN